MLHIEDLSDKSVEAGIYILEITLDDTRNIVTETTNILILDPPPDAPREVEQEEEIQESTNSTAEEEPLSDVE